MAKNAGAYVHPDRGQRDAYERYLAGMDASMRQKVALTAAHLLGRGRVADMGMGSGTGSHALAALYPELEVVGVDVDEQMVALARERFELPNLSFTVGDVAERVFPPATLDTILDSSVLHHVTSFNGYDHQAAARALRAQVEQLNPNGVVVVRDFVDPGPGEVLLDLPADDGDESNEPLSCSTAMLFERFTREFRSLAPVAGFDLERCEDDCAPLAPGRRRYRVSHKLAVEFLLRKDYRQDWAAEVKEEYTYFTREKFEEVFGALGLRVLVSSPLRNPWILRHRFHGQIAIWDAAGAELDWPATNYVIVGEKVLAKQGVCAVEAGAHPALEFLEMSHFLQRSTGQVRDLVRRPHATVDVLPWFRSGSEIFVIARASYPRPILSCDPRGTLAIDGSRSPHYVTEPLNVIQADKPLAQTAEELLGRVGFSADDILSFLPGTTYYPSPGGIQEEVRSVLVEVAPLLVRDELEPPPGLSTGGRVRAIEAEQLLRAAQVGGLPDARLELNVYDLLRRIRRAPGPWIGETLDLGGCDTSPPITTIEQLAQRAPRRLFRSAGAEQSSSFLLKECSVFHELDRDGARVGEKALEFVIPNFLSFNTVAVAVLARAGDEVLIGLDDDDLPAAQCFNGRSDLLVTPAWRLPRTISAPTQARRFIAARLLEEYGLQTADYCELGGRYHPSPGVTPEVVHPLATALVRQATSGRKLLWVRLIELIESKNEFLLDGHLRVVALRAAHSLGLIA